MTEKQLSLKGVEQFQLLGPQDEYLRIIENSFTVKIVIRGDNVLIAGDPEQVDPVNRIFSELIFLLNRNQTLSRADVQTVIDMVNAGSGRVTEQNDPDSRIVLYGRKGLIRPKNQKQEVYLDAVAKNDVVFVIGPAGTGKTYLAVAMALAQLREKEISRLILTRPAIEAGENLGFLPGDMMEKVDPYLRPLMDALFDMLPSDQLQKYVERKIIEIVPLAYMRGRTLNDAFVILDEAQNTTPVQMKMFLTRLGVHSRAVITGDITQIDLPNKSESGLVQIQDILSDIEGVGFVYFQKEDVVRHRLVKEIINAYELYHNSSEGEGA